MNRFNPINGVLGTPVSTGSEVRYVLVPMQGMSMRGVPMQGMPTQVVLKEMFQNILSLEKEDAKRREQLGQVQEQLVHVQKQLVHVQEQLVQVQVQYANTQEQLVQVQAPAQPEFAAAPVRPDTEWIPVTIKKRKGGGGGKKQKTGFSAAEIRQKNNTRMDREAQANDLTRLTNAQKSGAAAVAKLVLKTKAMQLQQIGVLLEMTVSSRNAVDALDALRDADNLDDESKKKFMKRFKKSYEEALLWREDLAKEQLVQVQAPAKPAFAAAPARPVPERPVRPVPERPVPVRAQAAAAAEWISVTAKKRIPTPKQKSIGWCLAFRKYDTCEWGDSCQHGHHEDEVTECDFGTLCKHKGTCYFKHTKTPICKYYANDKVCPHQICNYSHSTK